MLWITSVLRALVCTVPAALLLPIAARAVIAHFQTRCCSACLGLWRYDHVLDIAPVDNDKMQVFFAALA